MSNQKIFRGLVQQNLGTLKLYVPIVARVHGGHHPEFHEVHEIFNTLVSKIEAAGGAIPELEEEFASLRKITDSYAVPGDTCETYEAVYKMLGEMDGAYSKDS